MPWGDLSGISQCQNLQIVRIDFNQGQIAVAIHRQNAFRTIGLSVGEAHVEVPMLSDDVKVCSDDPIPADHESGSPSTFSAQAVYTFDHHDGRLDQLGEVFEILGVALGQFKFREGG